MGAIEASVSRYVSKMTGCKTMTELLLAMSSWQSFCDSNALTKAQEAEVNQAYLEAEQRLMAHVKTSLW